MIAEVAALRTNETETEAFTDPLLPSILDRASSGELREQRDPGVDRGGQAILYDKRLPTA